MVKKKVIIPSTTTLESLLLEGDVIYDTNVDKFSIRVENSPQLRYAVYEFDITEAMNLNFFESLFNPVVTKVELEYLFFQADTGLSIESIEFVQLLTRPSTAHIPQDIHEDIRDIHAVVYDSAEIHGEAKSKRTVTLGTGSTASACTALRDAAVGQTDRFFAVGIRRDQSVTGTGAVQLGGQVLHSGEDTDWEEATGTNLKGPPNLIVTYELDEEPHIELEMRYTTSDPTTAQGTPTNSVGGYASSNAVYSGAKLGDHISPSSSVISIASGSSLPSRTSGLIQIGPEIIKYGGLDASSGQIISLTRGLVPASAFPATVEPFAEKINYLVVSDLFNTNPSVGVDQYRCVAIINVSENRPAQSVQVILRQSPGANVQVDIGIEVPKFDTHNGAQFSTEASDGQIISDNTNFTTFATSFFDGAHIVIDGGTSAIVESFDVGSTGIATFILDRNVGTVSSGTGFRINPAQSQRTTNDVTAPVTNSNRFLGFFDDGGSNDIGFDNLRENVGDLQQYDLFYVWVKRTLVENIEEADDIGAIIIVEFEDSASS